MGTNGHIIVYGDRYQVNEKNVKDVPIVTLLARSDGHPQTLGLLLHETYKDHTIVGSYLKDEDKHNGMESFAVHLIAMLHSKLSYVYLYHPDEELVYPDFIYEFHNNKGELILQVRDRDMLLSVPDYIDSE